MSSLGKGLTSPLGMGLMYTLAMGHSYLVWSEPVESKPCRVRVCVGGGGSFHLGLALPVPLNSVN